MTDSRDVRMPRVRTLAAAIRGILHTPLGGQAALALAALSVVAPAPAQQLDEVVVTATRRDSTVEDIPYNISVVSAKTLEDNHVTSLADLTKQIAGVSFVDEGPLSRSNIVLRGINANGTDHPSVSTVAPVSTYIGETPLFIPLQIDDLERVEVLRGPQGTLYGSGSLAGTIRFIPKKPDLTGFHADIEADGSQVEVGHDFNDRFNGMVNMPFSSTVAMRISAGYQHYAGFIDERYIVKLGAPNTAINSPVGVPVSATPGNILGPLEFTPKDNANDSNQSHVRVSLLFKPDSDFSALLTYYHQNDVAYAIQAVSPNFGGNVDTPPAANPFYSAAYPVSFPTGGTVFPHNSTYDTNDSFLLDNKRHTDLVSADLSQDFGFATLSSDTSYYQDGGTDVADNTGLLTLYPSFYGFLPRMVDYETDYDHTNGFVQEFRLVSKPGVHFDYVLGAFYERLKSSSGQMQWIPGQTFFGGLVGDPVANAATLGDVNVIGNTQTYFRDLAGFGELTWHVTDAWQVTGGARQFSQDFSLNTSTAFPFCGVFCGNDGDALGTTSVNKGYAAHDHIFKLNTSYKVSDALNAYADYSQGFRRGGANGIPVSGPFAANPALLIYTPDKTKNYEVGVMDLLTLALVCGPLVAPATTLRVVAVESAGHPYAIHDDSDGHRYEPVTRQDAVKLAAHLLGAGHRLDLGLMQVNYAIWLSPTRVRLEFAFDPCTNIALGTTLLSAAYARALGHSGSTAEALNRALSRYHSGDELHALSYAKTVTAHDVPIVPSAIGKAIPSNPRKDALASRPTFETVVSR